MVYLSLVLLALYHGAQAEDQMPFVLSISFKKLVYSITGFFTTLEDRRLIQSVRLSRVRQG
jgi:hypothetical protein